MENQSDLLKIEQIERNKNEIVNSKSDSDVAKYRENDDEHTDTNTNTNKSGSKKNDEILILEILTQMVKN